MEQRDRQGMGERPGMAETWATETGRGVAHAEQAGRVTDLAAARGRQLVESAREGAQQAAEYVQGAVEQTRDKINEYREGGMDKVRRDAISYTRQEPMNALLIAAGVGVLVGWLTARGRR